jgi:uncharacterized membrane-anchored protein YhcB (DUF1043 family)
MKISQEEFDRLYDRAKSDLDDAESDYKKWSDKKVKLVKYYSNRFRKLEKNVARSSKNLLSAQKRVNAIMDLGSGTDINFSELRTKKVKVAEVTNELNIVDPRTGELITITNEELDNLLKRN